MLYRSAPCERASISLPISYPWRPRPSTSDRTSSSALPFFSSVSLSVGRRVIEICYVAIYRESIGSGAWTAADGEWLPGTAASAAGEIDRQGGQRGPGRGHECRRAPPRRERRGI